MIGKSPDIAELYIAADRADSWDRAKQRRQESTGAVTELMLDLVDLKPGSHVLDVAAGTGDSSLLAARRVQPGGRVLAVDVSATMLKRAEKAAQDAGLTNIETRVMNAENLDLDTDSFDAVICRSALMLFPKPIAALAEMRRVVKPSRKVTVIVHSSPEKNPYQSVPLEVVRRIGDMPSPPQTQPGMFALSGTGVLEGTYRQAGFQEPAIQFGAIRRKFSSLAHAIQSLNDSHAILQDLLVKLTDAERQRAWSEIQQALSQFEGPTGFDAPGEVIIGVGIK